MRCMGSLLIACCAAAKLVACAQPIRETSPNLISRVLFPQASFPPSKHFQAVLLRRGNPAGTSDSRRSRDAYVVKERIPLPRYPSPPPEPPNVQVNKKKERSKARVVLDVKGPGSAHTKVGTTGIITSHQMRESSPPRQVHRSHGARVEGFAQVLGPPPNRAEWNNMRLDLTGEQFPLKGHGQGRSVRVSVTAPPGGLGKIRMSNRSGHRTYFVAAESTLVKMVSEDTARGAHGFGSVSRPGIIKIEASDTNRGVSMER